MGRILVVHPRQGFLDTITHILTNVCEVEVFEHYQPAAYRLGVVEAYEAVLCGLADTAWALKIFEQAAACSADTRLIPVASDLIQLDSFREQWDSDARRKQKYGSIGPERLREHFTVGDIHKLFPPRAHELAPDATGKRAASNKESRTESDLPADQRSTAAGAQKQSSSAKAANPMSLAPYADEAEGRLTRYSCQPPAL
jgi:hypothetical protein